MTGTLLLIGGDSQIGAATARRLSQAGHRVTSTTRRRNALSEDRVYLDLAAPLDIWEPPPGTGAACIFAAVARLLACQQDPAGSSQVNVVQTISLVERLIERGIYTLFLSTNQVFDGSIPCVPANAPLTPISEYGRQKARTETALRLLMARGAPLAILRFAKVTAARMPLFEHWIAALSARRAVEAFVDMTMAPTPIDLAVDAVAALLRARDTGIFQLTGPEDVAYAEIARYLARRLDRSAALIAPISAHTAGMPPGATPRHTTLDSSAMRERFGIAVPGPWTVIENGLDLPSPRA